MLEGKRQKQNHTGEEVREYVQDLPLKVLGNSTMPRFLF